MTDKTTPLIKASLVRAALSIQTDEALQLRTEIKRDLAEMTARGVSMDLPFNRAMPGDPTLAHQGFYHRTQCRQPHTERSSGVRYFSLRMTTQKEEHASFERRHTNRFQTFSELPVQLQHQFQECQLLMAVVIDTSHGQCVVPLLHSLPHLNDPTQSV